MKTMGAVFGLLQMKLIAVTDLEAEKRFGHRVTKRDPRLVHDSIITIELSRRHMQKIKRMGVRARAAALAVLIGESE